MAFTSHVANTPNTDSDGKRGDCIKLVRQNRPVVPNGANIGGCCVSRCGCCWVGCCRLGDRMFGAVEGDDGSEEEPVVVGVVRGRLV